MNQMNADVARGPLKGSRQLVSHSLVLLAVPGHPLAQMFVDFGQHVDPDSLTSRIARS